MKKKVLISLTAMLAVFGLAFAALADPFDAATWWTTNSYIVDDFDVEAINANSLTAENYLKYKKTCDEWSQMSDDQKTAVASEASPYTKSLLNSLISSLNSKNNSVAATIVSGIETYFTTTLVPANALKGEITTLGASNTEGKWKDLEDWHGAGLITDDNKTAWEAKIADALNYIYADQFVADVDALIADDFEWVSAVKTNDELDNELMKSAHGYNNLHKNDIASYSAAIAQEKVQTALTKIEKRKIRNGYAQAKIDVKTAFDELTGKNGVYTLEAEDLNLSKNTTDYYILTDLKNANEALAADREAGWTLADEGFTAGQVLLISEMLAEQAKMATAVAFLNDDDNLYSQLPTPAFTSGDRVSTGLDKVKALQAKIVAPENASFMPYVHKLMTAEAVNTTLYNAAKTAFKAWDLEELKKEAYKEYTDVYGAIIAGDPVYEITGEDYVDPAANIGEGEVKAGGIRAAINARAAFNYTTATNYRTGYADEVWAIEDATYTEINTSATGQIDTNFGTALSTGIKTAADQYYTDKMSARLAEIYDAATAGILPYNEGTEAEGQAQALALKNKKDELTTAITNASKIGTTDATTAFQYYWWDAKNAKYETYTTLAELNAGENAKAVAAGETWTALTSSALRTTANTGYKDLYTPFKGSATLYTNYTSSSAVATSLTSLKNAAIFLDAKATLIWYDVEGNETLNVDGVGITSALNDLAVNVKASASTAGSYAALKAVVKPYIAPVYQVLWDNCEKATGDVESYSTGEVMVYSGTKASVEDKSSLTSWIDICKLATEATTPNTLVYVDDDTKDVDELPANVIVKDTEGYWVAKEINLVDYNNLYIPAKVTAEKITISKTITARAGKETNVVPMYFPFNVTVGDLKTATGDNNAIVRMMNTIYEKQDEEDPSKIELRMNFLRKINDTDICYANKPYTLEAIPGTFTVEVENTELTATPSANGSVQSSTAGSAVTAKLEGLYQSVNVAKETTKTSHYVVGKSTGEWGPYAKSAVTALPAGRVLLTITKNNNVQYIMRFGDVIKDDATGIETVNNNDGVALEGIYTINGQKVENMNKPGLYIVNGKKVIKK